MDFLGYLVRNPQLIPDQVCAEGGELVDIYCFVPGGKESSGNNKSSAPICVKGVEAHQC